MEYVFGLIFIVFIIAIWFTGLVRRYALANKILDIPNSRSSHTGIVPRGGGAAILASFLIGLMLLLWLEFLEFDIFIAVISAATMVAAIGLWDDCGHISAKWRLLTHLIAVCLGLYFLGVIPPENISDQFFTILLLKYILSVFLLVWLINLFNFMDGIDGIAGSESAFVSFGGAILAWASGSHGIAFTLLVLGMATSGFLMWNWPPAKIFMGDAGSGFLGVTLGILAFANITAGGPLWSWVILFGVFIIDASITLFMRILNNEKWYEAHRSHAYQWSARWWGHRKVTISVIVINILWLFPWALFSFVNPQWGKYALFVAFLPLVILAFVLKAGSRDVSD